MENNLFANDNAFANKIEEKIFTKPDRNGNVEFIEHEVDKFDYDGYEVVRREWFSKANCPAITIKYGSIALNVRAIKKLNECRFVHILMNIKKKSMIVKPCEEDDKDSLQCNRINKQGKLVSRTITGKVFTTQLYKDMKWNIGSTIKVLGTLLKCRDEKIFVFNLINAEAYLHLAEPTADDPKRRKRVAYMPKLWEENYGQSYEDSKIPIIETFDGMPDDYVKITIPKKIEQNNSNRKLEEKTENGTI